MSETPGNTNPDQDLIVILPPEETSRQKEVKQVAADAKDMALDRLRSADTLVDHLRWHRAASVYFTPNNIDWIWDFGGTTAMALLAEQETDNFTKLNQRNAKALEELKSAVGSVESKEESVIVALKRIRNEAGIYDYRVLVKFPNTSATDPLDYTQENNQRDGEDLVFFEPENACVSHACDDLYKQHRDKAFYAPLKTLNQAIRDLQANKQGANEYLLDKTDEGVLKQDAWNYILVGVLDGYNNERLRVRVSDYWNKKR